MYTYKPARELAVEHAIAKQSGDHCRTKCHMLLIRSSPWIAGYVYAAYIENSTAKLAKSRCWIHSKRKRCFAYVFVYIYIYIYILI